MTAKRCVKIDATWKLALDDEFEQAYMKALRDFLCQEKKAGKLIYPPGDKIFNAFNLTPFDQVKVVILGQDPYHGIGQAHGLCFSVQPGIRLPPSLQNIFKQIHQEYELEYGTDRIEVHSDAVGPGDRVLVVDDVLATGGTGAAAVRLVERLGAEVVGFKRANLYLVSQGLEPINWQV